MVNIFMDDLLGEEEYIRGKSEVKTLRLSGEKRQQLLENLQTVEVVNTNSALKCILEIKCSAIKGYI